MVMRCLIKRYTVFIFFTVCLTSYNGLAQQRHYDFDSLLQSSPQFEALAKIVFDTFQIFGPEVPLELTIESDLKGLGKNKYKDEYQPAKVIYDLWDTISVSREIRIKPRGEFRLKNCTNPPIRINVKKTEEVFRLLDDLGKLKMVVPCKGSNTYQNYIFTEYLAYVLYNIITDYSFQVRLVKVNYYDTSEKIKEGEAYTFIIENQKAMAERLESVPVENERMSAKYLDPEYAAIMYVYQFMIGNTDWSVPGLHNMKTLKTKEVTKPYPVPIPYDFDYSGLVDASYAIPGDHVGIEEVTEREYMGYCLPQELMDKTFDLFLEKEDQLIATVADFNLIDDRQKKKTLSYLGDFFDIIREPKRRDNRITNRCRQ